MSLGIANIGQQIFGWRIPQNLGLINLHDFEKGLSFIACILHSATGQVFWTVNVSETFLYFLNAFVADNISSAGLDFLGVILGMEFLLLSCPSHYVSCMRDDVSLHVAYLVFLFELN